MSWQGQAKAKRESIFNAIPQSWRIPQPIPSVEELKDVTLLPRQYLTEQEITITESDVESILQQTTTGKWKALDVAQAFAHRASIAHQVTNCLHEIFFDAAFEDAKKLDQYFDLHKAPIGPLHGLPISLKDQFHVKGVETTMGYVGWIGTFQGKKGTGLERKFESEMVRELRALGAVLYCKTSVPHTLMSGETVNNIIGYTWNPKNRYLGSGGSSGGEGALIALRGSPLGFGTDIGGSIRIPAAFCGIYGIRPSGGRMPYEGMANSMDGQPIILSVVGPLSSTIGGLRVAMRGLLTQQPWLHDPTVLELPWRSEQEDLVKRSPQQLNFGCLRNDGAVTPFPPVSRAIEEVVQVIQGAGNEVIDWKSPPHADVIDIVGYCWTADRGVDVHQAFSLSGEKVAPQLANLYGTEPKEPTSVVEMAQWNVRKREFQKKYMDYWNSTSAVTKNKAPVDALIMPLAQMPAAQPEKYDYYNYSTIINVLDYTSVIIPVTTVDKKVDITLQNHAPLSALDSGMKNYDPEIYDGAFVGVQIVCRRLQEEKALAIAEYVDSLLKARRQGSSSHQ